MRYIIYFFVVFCLNSTLQASDSISFQKSIDSALSKQQNITGPEDKITFHFFVADLYLASNQINFAQQQLKLALAEAEKLNNKTAMSDALLHLASFYESTEQFYKAIEQYQKIIEIEKSLNQKQKVAEIQQKLATAYTKIYKFQEAEEYFKKSLLSNTENNNELSATNYTLLGNLYRSNFAKAKEAIAYYQRALTIYQSLKDSTNIAWTLNRIGNCNIDLGNFKAAFELYNQSKTIHTQLKNNIGMVAGFNNIGEIFRYQGNYSGALEYYLEGLNISRQTNDDRSMAILLNNVGIIYYEQANYPIAIEYFNQSIERSKGIKFEEGMVETFAYLGLTYKKQNNFAKAMEFFNQSLALSQDIGDMLGKAFTLNAIAELYYEQGDMNKAYQYYNDAFLLEKEIQDQSGEVRSIIGMGKVKLLQNDVFTAMQLLTEALNKAKQLGLNPRVVETYQLLAEAYEKQNRFALALNYFKLYNQLNDSLQSSKVTQQIEVMQQKFVGEQREKELQLLLKEKELQAAAIEKNEAIIKEQSLKQTFTAIGLVMFLIAAVLGWLGYNERRKAFKTLDIQKKEIEAKNQHITDSIQYAKRIQSALITSKEYLIKVIPQHFVFYKAKDIVSGDFYWAYLTSDNKAIVAVVDCTGHGVPGAFMSMIGMGLLNEIVMEHKLTKPNEILNALRNGVITSLKQKSANDAADGMDISIIVWDKNTNWLEYAGANNPLYIVRNKQLTEIKADKQPIGYFMGRKKPFSIKSHQLEANDMIYLFTDGYADQFGGKHNKKFKYLNFKKLITQISDLPLQEQSQKIENTFIDWKQNYEQLDDICVLGIKV